MPGQYITWQSALGRLTGLVLERVGRAQVRVHHPLTQTDAVISLSRLVEVS
jgi:hypothetical protein